jgi:neutral amino acid transport system ATP-binding protein
VSPLQICGLVKTFGGVRALDGVSFSVPDGSIVGLIGPNGSGKTTLANCVAGLHRPDAGSIWYQDRRIDKLAPFQIARLGIGRTFQTGRLFPKLTVLENVLLARRQRLSSGVRLHGMTCLETLGIGGLADEEAGTLSVGQQRLLELAMNLMAEPAVWMLDEPVAGVHPNLRSVIKSHITRFRKDGKTFLIIEHNIPFILGICDHIVVLHLGRKIAEGPPREVMRNERVLDAYLGRSWT